MKTTKILGLLVITLLLFTACQEQTKRYTQTSPEIDHLKAAIADYEAGNWEGYMSHYADTAKIYHNTESKPISPKESADLLLKETRIILLMALTRTKVIVRWSSPMKAKLG
jgi:hypothetical protein